MIIKNNKKREPTEYTLASQQTTEKIKWKDRCVLAREQKQLWNMKVSVISIVIVALGTILRQTKRTRRFRYQRTRENHPNYSIIKVSQNTEKSPGNMRRLGFSQTSVKNQLTIVGQKTWPNNNQQKKKNLQNCQLCCSGWPQTKTERMWEEA